MLRIILGSLLIVADVVFFIIFLLKKDYFIFKGVEEYEGCCILPNLKITGYKKVLHGSYRFFVFLALTPILLFSGIYILVLNNLNEGFFNGFLDGVLIIPLLIELIKNSVYLSCSEVRYFVGLGIGLVISGTLLVYFIVVLIRNLYLKKFIRNDLDEDEKAERELQISDLKEDLLKKEESYDNEYYKYRNKTVSEEYDRLRDSEKPEDLLKKYKPSSKKEEQGLIASAFSFIGKVIDGGSGEAEKAEEQYNNIKTVYDVYRLRLELESIEFGHFRNCYEIAIKRANLFAQRIKQITSRLSPRERASLIDASNGIDDENQIEVSDFDIKQINSIRNEIERSRAQAGKQIKKNANSFLDTLSKSNDETEIAVSGVLNGISAIGAGISYLAERSENNARIVEEYTDATNELLAGIKTIEENRAELSVKTKRIKEITKAVNNALDAYTKSYEIVYNEIFPKNDSSKTRVARMARQEGFFTEDENVLIHEKLRQIVGFLMKTVDTEL